FGPVAVAPSRVGLTELLAGARQPVQRGGMVWVEGNRLAELPGRRRGVAAGELVPPLGRQPVDRVEIEQELLLEYRLVLDEQQRTGQLPEDAPGHAAEQHPHDAGPPGRTHHEQVCAALSGRGRNLLVRVPVTKLPLPLDAVERDASEELVELLDPF